MTYDRTTQNRMPRVREALAYARQDMDSLACEVMMSERIVSSRGTLIV